MTRQSVTPARLAVIALFAVSCLGLLIYLWSSFGGAVPLQSQGYRVTVVFPNAGRLGEEADVRIAGVRVGRVVKTDRRGNHTAAVIELEARYAPLPRDARAILRQKTALGETYVELTPGSPRAAKLADGGTLGSGQVADAVLFDQALSAFDPKTRRGLRSWLHGWSTAIDGRGSDLSATLGRLPATEVELTQVLGVLNSQRAAVRHLVGDSAEVLQAVGDRQGPIRRMISDGDRLFAVTARRSRGLRDTLRALPGLVRSARSATAAARVTGADLRPALRELLPAARELDPALRSAARAAGPARSLLAELPRTYAAARRGLPAARTLLSAAVPLVTALDPAARDLEPMLAYLRRYRQELVSAWALTAATTEASTVSVGGKRTHYVRLVPNVTDESATTAPRREPGNRHNAYPAPRWLDRLAQGLQSFDCENTGNRATVPDPGSGTPPCRAQGLDGEVTAFPRLRRSPPGS